MLLVLLNGHHPWLKFFDIFASNNGHLRAILNRDLKGGSRFNKNKLIILYCELFNQTLWQKNNTYLPLCKRWTPWSNTQLNICKHPSCCLFSQPKVNVLPQPSNNIKCKSTEEITAFYCTLVYLWSEQHQKVCMCGSVCMQCDASVFAHFNKFTFNSISLFQECKTKTEMQLFCNEYLIIYYHNLF